LAKAAYFARQRLAVLASPAPKAPEVKDYSAGAKKPDLRRTAWWGWQDSNLQPSGYERVEFIGKPAKYCRFCRRSGPFVHVWLRRFIGYSLVGPPPFPLAQGTDDGPLATMATIDPFLGTGNFASSFRGWTGSSAWVAQ
jgi:hypothetical protein